MALATESALDEALGLRYAADLFYRALLETGEPTKASEAARRVGRPDVDLRLARVALISHPDRFASSDRKWTLWARFADPERSVERNLDEMLELYGMPARASALAREMSAVYGRPTEVYERTLPRVLSDRERYFHAGQDEYGRAAWLLMVDSSHPDDVLFDNYLNEMDVLAFESGAESLDPQNLDTVLAFLDAADRPVPNKVLQFLAWRADPDHFDAASFYTALWRDGRAVPLSNGTWVGPAGLARLVGFFPALAEREVEEKGEGAGAEVAQPLTITDEDRERLVQEVLGSETTTRASRLLEDVYEVAPGETTYEGDLQTLIDCLRSDDRVVWVGTDRFVPDHAIPAYVFSVPEILNFPDVRFLDAEGNDVDVLLDDDGFDGDLEREIRSPMAQDVLDEEPVMSPDENPASTARCVLKYHHKEIGTFPLVQLAPGFFPIEPAIIQVDVMLPTGQKAECWVNSETRLLYGLLDWYQSLPVDSGAVIYLERQAPDRYALSHGDETEPAMFISRNRVNELMELGERADAEELPTFDLLREIMEHYRKGIEFITLLTEVNIARRSRRRAVASLLSAYHCFFQRGGAWVYDLKKLPQGFDKSKRKYLDR